MASPLLHDERVLGVLEGSTGPSVRA